MSSGRYSSVLSRRPEGEYLGSASATNFVDVKSIHLAYSVSRASLAHYLWYGRTFHRPLKRKLGNAKNHEAIDLLLSWDQTHSYTLVSNSI